MNSFKLLEEMEEREFRARPEDPVRRRLETTMSTFRFIGHVIDVYLPRMVDTFVAISGGSSKPAPPPDQPPTEPYNLNQEPPPGPSGPVMPPRGRR